MSEKPPRDITTFFKAKVTDSVITKGKKLQPPSKEAVRANGSTKFNIKHEFTHPVDSVLSASKLKADQLMDPEYFHVFNCWLDTTIAAEQLRDFFHTHDIHPEIYASRLRPIEPPENIEMKNKAEERKQNLLGKIVSSALKPKKPKKAEEEGPWTGDFEFGIFIKNLQEGIDTILNDAKWNMKRSVAVFTPDLGRTIAFRPPRTPPKFPNNAPNNTTQPNSPSFTAASPTSPAPISTSPEETPNIDQEKTEEEEEEVEKSSQDSVSDLDEQEKGFRPLPKELEMMQAVEFTPGILMRDVEEVRAGTEDDPQQPGQTGTFILRYFSFDSLPESFALVSTFKTPEGIPLTVDFTSSSIKKNEWMIQGFKLLMENEKRILLNEKRAAAHEKKLAELEKAKEREKDEESDESRDEKEEKVEPEEEIDLAYYYGVLRSGIIVKHHDQETATRDIMISTPDNGNSLCFRVPAHLKPKKLPIYDSVDPNTSIIYFKDVMQIRSGVEPDPYFLGCFGTENLRTMCPPKLHHLSISLLPFDSNRNTIDVTARNSKDFTALYNLLDNLVLKAKLDQEAQERVKREKEEQKKREAEEITFDNIVNTFSNLIDEQPEQVVEDEEEEEELQVQEEYPVYEEPVQVEEAPQQEKQPEEKIEEIIPKKKISPLEQFLIDFKVGFVVLQHVEPKKLSRPITIYTIGSNGKNIYLRRPTDEELTASFLKGFKIKDPEDTYSDVSSLPIFHMAQVEEIRNGNAEDPDQVAKLGSAVLRKFCTAKQMQRSFSVFAKKAELHVTVGTGENLNYILKGLDMVLQSPDDDNTVFDAEQEEAEKGPYKKLKKKRRLRLKEQPCDVFSDYLKHGILMVYHRKTYGSIPVILKSEDKGRTIIVEKLPENEIDSSESEEEEEEVSPEEKNNQKLEFIHDDDEMFKEESLFYDRKKDEMQKKVLAAKKKKLLFKKGKTEDGLSLFDPNLPITITIVSMACVRELRSGSQTDPTSFLGLATGTETLRVSCPASALTNSFTIFKEVYILPENFNESTENFTNNTIQIKIEEVNLTALTEKDFNVMLGGLFGLRRSLLPVRKYQQREYELQTFKKNHFFALSDDALTTFDMEAFLRSLRNGFQVTSHDLKNKSRPVVLYSRDHGISVLLRMPSNERGPKAKRKYVDLNTRPPLLLRDIIEVRPGLAPDPNGLPEERGTLVLRTFCEPEKLRLSFALLTHQEHTCCHFTARSPEQFQFLMTGFVKISYDAKRLVQIQLKPRLLEDIEKEEEEKRKEEEKKKKKEQKDDDDDDDDFIFPIQNQPQTTIEKEDDTLNIIAAAMAKAFEQAERVDGDDENVILEDEEGEGEGEEDIEEGHAENGEKPEKDDRPLFGRFTKFMSELLEKSDEEENEAEENVPEEVLGISMVDKLGDLDFFIEIIRSGITLILHDPFIQRRDIIMTSIDGGDTFIMYPVQANLIYEDINPNRPFLWISDILEIRSGLEIDPDAVSNDQTGTSILRMCCLNEEELARSFSIITHNRTIDFTVPSLEKLDFMLAGLRKLRERRIDPAKRVEDDRPLIFPGPSKIDLGFFIEVIEKGINLTLIPEGTMQPDTVIVWTDSACRSFLFTSHPGTNKAIIPSEPFSLENIDDFQNIKEDNYPISSNPILNKCDEEQIALTFFLKSSTGRILWFSAESEYQYRFMIAGLERLFVLSCGGSAPYDFAHTTSSPKYNMLMGIKETPSVPVLPENTNENSNPDENVNQDPMLVQDPGLDITSQHENVIDLEDIRSQKTTKTEMESVIESVIQSIWSFNIFNDDDDDDQQSRRNSLESLPENEPFVDKTFQEQQQPVDPENMKDFFAPLPDELALTQENLEKMSTMQENDDRMSVKSGTIRDLSPSSNVYSDNLLEGFNDTQDYTSQKVLQRDMDAFLKALSNGIMLLQHDLIKGSRPIIIKLARNREVIDLLSPTSLSSGFTTKNYSDLLSNPISIPICDIMEVRAGTAVDPLECDQSKTGTVTLREFSKEGILDRSFSMIFENNFSLDFSCKTIEQFQLIFCGISFVQSLRNFMNSQFKEQETQKEVVHPVTLNEMRAHHTSFRRKLTLHSMGIDQTKKQLSYNARRHEQQKHHSPVSSGSPSYQPSPKSTRKSFISKIFSSDSPSNLLSAKKMAHSHSHSPVSSPQASFSKSKALSKSKASPLLQNRSRQSVDVLEKLIENEYANIQDNNLTHFFDIIKETVVITELGAAFGQRQSRFRFSGDESVLFHEVPIHGEFNSYRETKYKLTMLSEIRLGLSIDHLALKTTEKMRHLCPPEYLANSFVVVFKDGSKMYVCCSEVEMFQFLYVGFQLLLRSLRDVDMEQPKTTTVSRRNSKDSVASEFLSEDVIEKISGYMFYSSRVEISGQEVVLNDDYSGDPYYIQNDYDLDAFKEALKLGILIIKHDRNGNSRLRILYSDENCETLTWKVPSEYQQTEKSKKKKIDEPRPVMKLVDLLQVRPANSHDESAPGKKGTKVMRKACKKELLYLSFSLIFPDRSIDITCQSFDQLEFIMPGFAVLRAYLHGEHVIIRKKVVRPAKSHRLRPNESKVIETKQVTEQVVRVQSRTKYTSRSTSRRFIPDEEQHLRNMNAT